VSAVQPRNKLTSREYEVLTALNDGLTTKAITRLLNITESTVKNHIKNLFDKLGVGSRLELVMFARYHRVLESNERSGLGFSLTNDQRSLILRAINGQLREEDGEPARRLADSIALTRTNEIMRKNAA
jgi:DNA-binding CsgD family transcriptional regulator